MTTYDDDVDTWTLAAVLDGLASFDDLVCHLPGVYPTDVRASLDRLHARSAITAQQRDRALRRQPMPPLAPPSPNLPVPHPLDFDWRFTPAAVESLVAGCERAARTSAGVICVGAPSLHERLLASGTESTLIDANDEIVSALSRLGPGAICARVGCDPLPDVVADAVVIDPPWYPEHVALFLWAASRLCVDEGVVLLSFPPTGTRPGVADEREQALTFATGVGLRLVDIHRGELAYRSPPFEQIALTAAGFVDLPEDWRRGDLLVFRAVSGRDSSVPPPAPVVDDVDWTAVPAAPARIKVRCAAHRALERPVRPRMNSIVDGDVLPSVSRRDPRREAASVWTSCNRVFACDDTLALGAIANARARGCDAVDVVADIVGRGLAGQEEKEVRDTVAQFDNLVRLESRDLESCGWVTRPS